MVKTWNLSLYFISKV